MLWKWDSLATIIRQADVQNVPFQPARLREAAVIILCQPLVPMEQDVIASSISA